MLCRSLEFLKEVVNVLADFIALFLIDEMGNSFHYNYLFQQRHMFLELAIVYEILGAQRIINKVLISHDELNWNFYLSTSPGCKEFPIPADKWKQLPIALAWNLDTKKKLVISKHLSKINL